jgi:tryptophanyl-tRNA synthetase
MRIMSGIQPTGNVHIGNYLGALKTCAELQTRHESSFFAVVDLHALTIRPDPASLRAAVRDTAVALLATGIDPNRAVLFVQSQVPGHTELAWILSCVTQLGDLNRMTQFKDKSQRQPENINAGLFTYPVLQAADIAIYRADGVPVGEDQVQHLELSREILRRFNGVYGQTFVEPAAILSKAPRVMGLDGETKMSKSRNNEIGLFEPPDSVMAKLRGAKTDPQRLRRSDPGDPSVCNIFSYHGFFTDSATRAQIDRDCRAAGIGCVDCKKILAANMERDLAPVRERAARLRAMPGEVDEVLAAGAERARREAAATMEIVRDRIGIR